MFYCPECARKKNWPESLSRSHGPCELCNRTTLCFDMPSRLLPLPPEPQPPRLTVTVDAGDLQYLLGHVADEIHGHPDPSHWKLPLLTQAIARLSAAARGG